MLEAHTEEECAGKRVQSAVLASTSDRCSFGRGRRRRWHLHHRGILVKRVAHGLQHGLSTPNLYLAVLRQGKAATRATWRSDNSVKDATAQGIVNHFGENVAPAAGRRWPHRLPAQAPPRPPDKSNCMPSMRQQLILTEGTLQASLSVNTSWLTTIGNKSIAVQTLNLHVAWPESFHEDTRDERRPPTNLNCHIVQLRWRWRTG